eukprot:m.252445 g.252445  ORF g.252445 m.252445 type:complete len:337 (-) comp17773_c0_seq1:120-1130(-)
MAAAEPSEPDDKWAELERKLKMRSVVDPETGCFNWTGTFRNIPTYRGGSALRLVYACKQRADVPKDVTLHRTCGNKLCVNAEHLAPGSTSDALKQRVIRTGRPMQKSVIDVELARKIKFDRVGSRRDRAIRYSVAEHIVGGIDRGHSFNWLGETPASDDPTKASTRVKPARMPFGSEFYAKGRDWITKHSLPMTDEQGEHLLCVGGRTTVDGYIQVILGANAMWAHRLSYISFNETSIGEGLVCRHKCRQKTCVNVEHLELGTPADNARDKIRDGTVLRGSAHPRSKIDEATALLIFQSKGSATQVERASRFGVSIATVEHLDAGRSWGHITQGQL